MVNRREFITGFGSIAALSILAPLQAVSAPSAAELGRKAHRGNAELIQQCGIRVRRELVEVGGERFAILLFDKSGPNAQKFFVPHDNEVAAFDTALRFVGEHGGTLITFDSAGGRNLKTEGGRPTSQDPNRMFVETSPYWPLAKHMLELVQEKGTPTITLHNNGPIGSFITSLDNPSREGLTLHVVNKAMRRDIVWVAGEESNDDSPHRDTIRALNAEGVNCLYERVDIAKRSDGSLSQYCARNGVPYFNIEVGIQGLSENHVLDSRNRQTVILQALMGALGTAKKGS